MMGTTKAVKVLIDWLKQYAFVGWFLMNHSDLGIEYLIEMSEKQTEEYQALIDEFQKEQILVLQEAMTE